MPSAYLVGADLASYGVPTATSDQIQAASTQIDSQLKRPEGLVWMPDAAGNPCYMVAKTAERTFVSSAPISPGTNVVVPLSQNIAIAAQPGEVVILDRANTAAVEACVVTAIGASTITLASVAYAHSSGVTMETGLTLREERFLPSKRPVTRLSRFPLARILSGMGKYSYGRRSDQVAGAYNDMNFLLASVNAFGGPPAWVAFDVTQCSVSIETGEVVVPAGALLAYYSDVRLQYVAGYAAASIPPAIKQACANVITAMQTNPDLIAGGVKSVQAGGSRIERFADTIFNADTMSLLAPYIATLNF